MFAFSCRAAKTKKTATNASQSRAIQSTSELPGTCRRTPLPPHNSCSSPAPTSLLRPQLGLPDPPASDGNDPPHHRRGLVRPLILLHPCCLLLCPVWLRSPLLSSLSSFGFAAAPNKSFFSSDPSSAPAPAPAIATTHMVLSSNMPSLPSQARPPRTH